MTLGITRSGRNVRQPNRILANSIAGYKAERRPGAGEEWLAVTKHDGVEVEPILIDKTKVGQASCQVRSADFNLPVEFSLQPKYQRLEVIFDKCSVGPTDFSECDTTHFGWLRHAAAKSRSSASHSGRSSSQ